MTWNGTGTFNPPGTPEFPAIVNDLIRAEYYNTVIEALCAAFSNTIPRDGQAAITGNINAGGSFRLINLPAAIANGQTVRYNEFAALQLQVQNLGNSVEPFIYFNAGIV